MSKSDVLEQKKTGKTCRHGNSIMTTEIYNGNQVGTIAA
jgi:hypothetical protein